jgi:hypothetical protein
VARKRRTRPHPGRQAEPAAQGRAARSAAPPPREPTEAVRLPWKLDRRQKLLILGVFVTGVGSFATLVNGLETYEDLPWLPGALTVACLACCFALEREQIERRGRAILRYAGFGVLVPVAVALNVGVAVLTPTSVLIGLSAYRLGLGAVTAPTIVATLGTLAVTGNPGFAYLVCTAGVWPGVGVLLLTRAKP